MVKRSPLDGFFYLGTYRQQQTRNLILLAKDLMWKLVVLFHIELSYLPRIVSDEFEVARLQYVLAGLLFFLIQNARFSNTISSLKPKICPNNGSSFLSSDSK